MDHSIEELKANICRSLPALCQEVLSLFVWRQLNETAGELWRQAAQVAGIEALLDDRSTIFTTHEYSTHQISPAQYTAV